ncbi:Histone-fold [Artemisia annua]|uniref:Histone-fold n=1 Tax=Artemisia annua TaxID=35608 RepID=A0A2U1Q6T9_ARTAN|nr:Histone-fold [Artemisia annua]
MMMRQRRVCCKGLSKQTGVVEEGVGAEFVVDLGEFTEAPLMAQFACEKHQLDYELEELDSQKNHHIAPAMTVDPTPVRNFDLNLDLDVNGNTPPVSAPVTPAGLASKVTFEMIAKEYPGWSLADVEKMATDPIKL